MYRFRAKNCTLDGMQHLRGIWSQHEGRFPLWLVSCLGHKTVGRNSPEKTTTIGFNQQTFGIGIRTIISSPMLQNNYRILIILQNSRYSFNAKVHAPVIYILQIKQNYQLLFSDHCRHFKTLHRPKSHLNHTR